MVKKRARDVDRIQEAPRTAVDDGGSSSSDEDMDVVNVDFEWFNMKPDADFHGLRNLLRQLFDVDSQLFDLSALADLILSQPTIGSTIKVDGEEADPYAFITVLSLNEHRDNSAIKVLAEYIVEKAESIPSLGQLAGLLSSSSSQIGLILTERLINIPPEVVPPMYSMLVDEIEAAVEDEEPYEFTHYLIISKTYLEIVSALDQGDAPRSKKSRAGKAEKELFYFHPEDEVLQRLALAFGGYEYTRDEGDAKADSKRAFQEAGIRPQGHMILIEASRFEEAVKAVESYIGTPGVQQ